MSDVSEEVALTTHISCAGKDCGRKIQVNVWLSGDSVRSGEAADWFAKAKNQVMEEAKNRRWEQRDDEWHCLRCIANKVDPT